jgi:beta-lactamase superfamily II metal-dependent hydrolase
MFGAYIDSTRSSRHEVLEEDQNAPSGVGIAAVQRTGSSTPFHTARQRKDNSVNNTRLNTEINAMLNRVTTLRLPLTAGCAAVLLSGCALLAPRSDLPVPPPAPAPVMEAPAQAPQERIDITGRRADQWQRMSRPPNTMDVWMLNVGQGACTFIACPDGKSNLLVDCGTDMIGGTPDTAITDWVNEKNAAASTVTVLVSHGHRDHLSFLRLKEGVDPTLVSKLLLGGIKDDYTKAFHNWADKAKSTATYFKSTEFKANDSRFQCGAAKVDLLTANATEVDNPAYYFSKKNADSAIVRVSLGKHAVIIPGDAEGISEQSAIDNAARNGLKIAGASLVIGSHHGAHTHGSNGANWRTALAPHAGAFSANLDASHRHPRCSIVDGYRAATDPVAPGFDMACGDGTKRSDITLGTRLFNTHDNGHVLARITASSITYLCQTMTPACDMELPDDMRP